MNERESGLPARESMESDTVIVGARPVGLAAAIRLKQMAAAADRDISVVVIKKGSDVGAHILSGAVIDPTELAALIPDWKERGAPVTTPVTKDRFLCLGPAGSLHLPGFLMAPLMSNHGNYIVSLGQLVCWLGEQSPIAKDLRRVRNAKPLWSRFGTALDIPLAGIDMWLNTSALRGAIVRPASMRYWRDLTASLVSRLMPKTACIALGLVFDSN